MSILKSNPAVVQRFKDAALPLILLTLSMVHSFSINSVLVAFSTILLVLAGPWLSDKRNRSRAQKSFLIMIGLLSTVFFNVLTQPAHAQFFNKAQTFFTSSFTSSGQAIPIVFNTLRALYIIYLAIAFIGVFNSVRQDEDWITAARTPIVVVICVTLADLLTGLITGT
jgi:quinol-cytochrome oxidoreductase complex cytochrome b subunit